jgi:hypothetical protein
VLGSGERKKRVDLVTRHCSRFAVKENLEEEEATDSDAAE